VTVNGTFDGVGGVQVRGRHDICAGRAEAQRYERDARRRQLSVDGDLVALGQAVIRRATGTVIEYAR